MIRNIIAILKIPFLIPHLIFFLLSANRRLISDDIKATCKTWGVKGNLWYLLIWLLSFDRHFRNLFYYRVGTWSFLLKLYCHGDPSFIISTKHILGGVKLSHPYATIIHAESIGANFSCRQCTTIGNKIDGRNDLLPIIGDNVTLGANVVIIGKVTIGSNSTIGAGCVVVKSVPDNSVVVGNPMRIINQ